MLCPRISAVVVQHVLLHIAFSAAIRVKHLVHCVTFSLACALAKIQGFEVERVVTEQRVAQHKHIVDAITAACYQAGAIGILTFITALHNRHAGRSRLYPHKFPVVIEVVGQELTRLKGRVAKLAG